jgi:hypothetical protein
MKPAALLPLLLVAGLSGGYVLGRRTGGGATPPSPPAAATPPPQPPGQTKSNPLAGAGARAATAASAGIAVGNGGPSVQALLAGFDQKKPVESNLRILQKILAAKPQELGEIVRGMAGTWRNDPGWQQAKQAALQRWVQIAPDEALAWARATKGTQSFEAVGVYGALAAIDPARALTEAKAVGSPMLQRQALQAVLETIAQTDPQRALRLSDDLPGNLQQRIAYTVYDAWATRDPAGAAAGLGQLKDVNQRRNALYAVMNQWGQRDPAGALAWARQVPEPGMRLEAMRHVFGQMGGRDPEQALAMASDLPKHQQVQMHKAVLGGWAQSDPEAAEKWIMGRTDKIEQQQMILAAVDYLDWMAPDRAGAMLTKLAPGSARDQALQNLVRNWSWNDAAGARDFTQSLPEAEQKRLHATVAEALAGRNPEEAMDYLKEHPIDDPAHEAWARLARSITDQASPEKALEWARGLEDEVTRRKALPEIFSLMAASDPAAAARAVLDLPAGSSREESLARIGGQWAGNNFEDALGWARGLSGKDRESALGAVLNQGAPHQPTSAATQYDSLLADVPAGQKPADSFLSAAATIAGAYFAEDQSKAAAWVASLPQPDAQAAAAQRLAEQWAQYDAPAASEWIGTLPTGKARDQAVGALVGRIAASDPAMAFEWAATVEDTTARGSLLENTLQAWRKLDPDAARDAVNTTAWPEEEKIRWLEKVR